MVVKIVVIGGTILMNDIAIDILYYNNRPVILFLSHGWAAVDLVAGR
jgi:hypothetical protein